MILICVFLIVTVIVLHLKLKKARQRIEEMRYELNRKQEWLEVYEKMYNDFLEKRVYIKDPFFDERAPEYERVEYVPADKIKLDWDIDRIEREVESGYDIYKRILDESQVLREKHEKENISYEELAGTSDEAYACFCQPNAIRGHKEGNTYTLVNGNHRVFLAKKLGMDVPYIILSKGQYITVRELVNRGVLDWNSIPKSEEMIDTVGWAAYPITM